MSASPPCATPPGAAPPPVPPDTLLAAANMRRLLEVYRSLAPLTIGGPSSTSLESAGSQHPARGPPSDPRLLRKMAGPGPGYPWMLGPGFPPPGLGPGSPHHAPASPFHKGDMADHRKRHLSSERRGCGSPAPPIFSPRDKESSSLRESQLDGQTISCFCVGGEDRLCLTQLLQLVLHDIPLARIHQACDELQIFCSTCSPAQLAALKLARVLPISAAQCGLITKSDAERLCSLLVTEPGATRERHSSGAPSESAPPPAPGSPAPPTVAPSSPSGGGAVSPPRGDPTSFKVQHECFGDCVGVIHPQSYSSQGAKCIECAECQSWMSPAKFVCHSHSKQENRTCHWGFDSANWAAYIQVFEDYSEEEQDKYKEELESIKKRFSHTKVKRKWIENDREAYKRSRHEEDGGRYNCDLGAGGPGGRQPLDLSGGHFSGHGGHGSEAGPGHQPAGPLNPVFLNPMSIPFPGPEKVGFPMMDPRQFYLQWAAAGNPLAANPYLAGGMRPPGPLPAPYLHSLAQFHNLKALATKTFLEQQNLAKSILQQSQPSHTASASHYERRGGSKGGEADSRSSPAVGASEPGPGETAHTAHAPGLSEFHVSVSAVLENTSGLDHLAKSRVMSVVSRLVDKLHRTEAERDTATLQLKGTEERVAKLEKALEDRSIEKTEDVGDGVPMYESSSDAGIESGNEVDDSLSEK